MLLNQKLSDTGAWFFRWRSFIPLIFVPVILLTLPLSEPIERIAGDRIGDLFEIACILLVALGLGLRAFTVGFVPDTTSGRNTRLQKAGVLNVTGIYSLTRNPLYLANCMVYAGIVLFTQNLLLSFAFLLFLVIYYERIILAEEAFLLDRFGADYADWAARVPAFFPKLSGWRKPELPFSVRTVLRREYPGWFAAVLALSALEFGSDVYEHEPEGWLDLGWLSAVVVAALLYLALRTLKKKTRLLDAPDR